MHKFKYLSLRLLSFITDYVIILTYLILLYLLITFLDPFFQIQQHYENYYLFRHFISFGLVTLPVVLYFILMENSGFRATIGKMIWGFMVNTDSITENRTGSIIKRNIIKFLPWEMAHIAIHINPDFEFADTFPGNVSLFLLILSQALALIYMLSIILNDKSSSVYDIIAGTMVNRKNENINFKLSLN